MTDAAGMDKAPALDYNIVREIRRRVRRLDCGVFGIGVEILPHELIGVMTDADGTRLGAARMDLVSMDIEVVVPRIAELARELADASLALGLSDPRLCLGVELGALVDADIGVVRFYVNNPHDHGKNKPPYQWTEENLADRIQEATGCVTVLENDAHAYTAYEQKLGVGRRTASFALLLIRHGIGAGVVLNNQLLPIPAEVGHLTAWPDGRLCDCGKGAHLESRAGRRAIPAIVADKTQLMGGSFEWAVNLANGSRPRAAKALEAFTEAGAAIARGIASILTIFGSPHLVIYGPEALVVDGAGHAAEAFMQETRKFPEYTFRHLGECELITKPLEPECGAIGAALIALNRHFSIPLTPSLEPTQ